MSENFWITDHQVFCGPDPFDVESFCNAIRPWARHIVVKPDMGAVPPEFRVEYELVKCPVGEEYVE